MAPNPDPTTLLPPMILLVILSFIIAAAALANCGLIAALLKSCSKGISAILIQLAVVDFIMIGLIIGPEMWSSNTGTWPFGYLACKLYGGLDIFISTMTLYLTLAATLQSTTVARLEITTINKLMTRNNKDDDEEMQSSRHSLMTSSDSSTPPRSFNEVYNFNSLVEVPVMAPCLFVWVLSASLSVPHFVLIHTNSNKKGQILCNIADLEYQNNVYVLLSVFCIGIPLFILIILCVATANCLGNIENISVSRHYTKLSVCLILVYCMLSLPRSLLKIYCALAIDIQINEVMYFPSWTLLLNGMYLISTLMRPILSIIILPNIRKYFIFCKKYIHQEI